MMWAKPTRHPGSARMINEEPKNGRDYPAHEKNCSTSTQYNKQELEDIEELEKLIMETKRKTALPAVLSHYFLPKIENRNFCLKCLELVEKQYEDANILSSWILFMRKFINSELSEELLSLWETTKSRPMLEVYEKAIMIQTKDSNYDYLIMFIPNIQTL
jgi:hypothetical protein